MVIDEVSVYRLMLIVVFAGVESQGQAFYSTGLYFTLNGTVYLPNDTILITDIGSSNSNNKSDPGSSLVCVTTNVNIQCCRSADGGAKGEWYLPDRTRIVSNPNNSFYKIRYTQQVRLSRKNNAMSPTGIFTCEVPNMSNTTSHFATIRIALPTTTGATVPSTSLTTITTTSTTTTTIPPLTVRIVSSGGTLRAGQNHMLTCEASGSGSMVYTYIWLKDGSVVSGQTSSTYSFISLEVADSGRYSCRVSDGSMTVASEDVDITVLGTLYFTWRGNRYEPGDSILITDVGLHLTSGNNIGPGDSLVCNTTDVNTQCCTDRGGVGEWFFPNGSMVLRNIDDPSASTQIIRTGRANQVRLNFRIGQTSPTGEYTCVVPETDGSVTQTAGIRLVTELPQLNVMLTGSGGTLTEGQNHVLTCTASGGGSMAYTYIWLRNGSVVPSLNSSTYSFSPLLVADSGQYSCQVTVCCTTMNTSGVVSITVVDPYSPRHPESVIVTSTTPTGVTIQWMVTEPFNATRPETFVVLYGITQNGLTRTSTSMVNATTTSQTYSIQLNSLDIGTQYYFQVQSRNRFGSVVSNVRDFTTNDTMSGPVTDLRTNSPDNSTLVISWRPPTTPNGNIISYTVRIDNLRDGTTLRYIMNHNAAMTSLTEIDLVPGVPYSVSVAAVNRAGQGSITTLTNFTKELAPSISPRNVSITRTSLTVMVVSWIPLTLSEARGFITSYTVFYSPQVSRRKRQEPNTMQKTVSGDVNQTTIDGLNSNTAYDVQMSANTKAGASTLSDMISAPVPDAVSGPVTDLQTNSPDDITLVIIWRPPNTPNGNIISYIVRIENLRDGTTLRYIVDPSPVTTSLTENGLVPGVPYSVSVAAVNRAGQGSITILTNFTKELEPNHPPKNIKVNRIHPTVMVVFWIPLTLSEARGFITSYTVFYSPQVSKRKRQEPNTMQKTVSGNVNRTTIDDLDPNFVYDVQMSANTKAGASSLSAVISAPIPLDTGDGGGLLIVVILVALVMGLVFILIIILLVLLVLKMQRTVKTRNKELVELRTHNIADQSCIYEIIDKEQDERRNETFSEIKSSSTIDTINSQSKVEELALSQCPAYVSLNSPSAARDEEDVEDKKNGTVNPT